MGFPNLEMYFMPTHHKEKSPLSLSYDINNHKIQITDRNGVKISKKMSYSDFSDNVEGFVAELKTRGYEVNQESQDTNGLFDD